VNQASTRLGRVALLGLLTVSVHLPPTEARTDADATDRHEVPMFVRERVELVSDAANASCPPLCSQPDGAARCASPARSPALTARLRIWPERPAGVACGANEPEHLRR
jgi:hypothetical protein